jgi:transcriptional regulator with XRE-family HTH domain
MISENIKKYRLEKGLTQAQLAEKLFVTAQAVSRWENGEVEPSVDTITKMSKLFDVSTDQLLGVEVKEESVSLEENDESKDDMPVLGVCELCKKPIFGKNDLIYDKYTTTHRSGRTTNHVSHTRTICSSCKNKLIEEEKAKEKAKYESLKQKAKVRRIWTFVIGVVLLGLMITCIVLGIINSNNMYFVGAIGCVFAFTLESCLIFDNNIVLEILASVIKWGFVKFPGIIFSLSFDGIVFLILTKILFFVLGIVLVLGSVALAIALSALVSLFVYPFALINNINHPEKI